VFVVPVSEPTDSTHVHTLTDAVTAAGASGLVTIEAGASPDPLPVTVVQNDITIQGDPNVPADILPADDITIQSNFVTLRNLHINSLIIGQVTVPSGEDEISKCLIREISATDIGSTYTQNTITQIFEVHGNDQVGGDIIADNTFASSVNDTVLAVFDHPGAAIMHNTFFCEAAGIRLFDAGNYRGTPTVLANNTITFAGAQGSFGIAVEQNGITNSDVKIVNNTIDMSNHGTGLLILPGDMADSLNFKLSVEGNDFHNSTIGVSIGGGPGNIDMGGGPLGSRGGNDFRGFVAPATATAAAIVLTPSGTVVAKQNIFSSGVQPSSVTFVDQGGEE
jgi:hypothetical protein